MDAAKALIRTCTRSFHDTKQTLIIDALLIHSVLHAEDLAILLATQPKEIRKYANPLKTARLLTTQTRVEAKLGSSSNRGVQREYYFIPFHPAIDAIKFRIARLRRKVEQMYQQDVAKKEWRCPRCKAEWETVEVVDLVGEEGFLCHRCGGVLEQTEQAAEPTGNHEKIRRLNIQLRKFDDLIAKIDAQRIPENNFFEAWERKKDVPRASGTGQVVREYIALSSNRRDDRARGPEQTDASALSINLRSGAEQAKEEEARKEARRLELAKQNQLPVWHTRSAIGTEGPGVKTEGAGLTNGLLKKEENDEKKPDIAMQSELDAYVAEMEREKEEEARQRAEEDAAEDDDNVGEDDEDDFEDVVSTSAMGTPSSSMNMNTAAVANGIKREFDGFESGPSSDANTPAAVGIVTPASTSEAGREAKRVKFEHEVDSKLIKRGAVIKSEDSDDDEEDFEDAM